MAVTSIAPRETPTPSLRRSNSAHAPASSHDPAHAPVSSSTHNTGQPVPARPSRNATDDEILGLDGTSVGAGLKLAPTANDSAEAPPTIADQSSDAASRPLDPESLRAALDANPDLRRAWDDAQAYRETFATPEEARTATALLADIDRLDALFFSRRPEDHAELARTVASLDPSAFASLAQAMNGLATETQSRRGDGVVGAQSANNSGRTPDPALHTANHGHDLPRGAFPAIGEAQPSTLAGRSTATPLQPTAAQTEFFHATNAAAVEGVLEAIESQVERLLPEGVSKSGRNRVVGEIYRELDTTLRSNRQLGQQMRDAFRSGSLDSEHQRALVSLVTGRARQALPGVAKRVLGEWTSTMVAANQDRRARQQAAERRVDIAGSGGTGSDGSRSMSPREIDYRRMSDADILNL